MALALHSGEVLRSDGAAGLAMPYGSVLKPFVVAGATTPPTLPPRRDRPEWICGDELPELMDAATAILRSCNGYFLDWAQQDPAVPRLGAWGPLTLALGLPRLPEDMAEAIGIKPALSLSPLAVAQLYRTLALARPDLIDVMRQNAARGTLSELPVSAALRDVALKTGTVRDDASRPRVGWIVAVDRELVLVLVRRERSPRQFADQLVEPLRTLRRRLDLAATEVQVLGLIPPEHVEAQCEGVAVSAHASGPVLLDRRFGPLLAAADGAPALCLGAPWQVRFPDIAPDHRNYAGVFRLSPPPRYRPPAGERVSRRQQLARQGSSFVFTTTLGRYTAGVLRAEDDGIRGEPRIALGRVIAHNARDRTRHDGRPPCDTTHCQVFQSTPLWQDTARALSPLPYPGWLAFSRGGQEPWSQRRTTAEFDELLGSGWQNLRVEEDRATYLRSVSRGDLTYDEVASLPCEVLRSRLRLPSCPDKVARQGSQVELSGHGEGHGQGLDVEAAKKTGLGADAILDQAYGPRSASRARPFSPAPPRGKK
ncbi:MAG: hypothetical protein ABIJ09_07660 [Pseudomonadota bacterium]